MSVNSSDFLPLVNGVRHSWASISFNALGRTYQGIAAIKYDDKQTKENYWGAGTKPVARGNGKYEAKASITLYAYEVQAIQDALGDPTLRLQDIDPFDIVVAFIAEGQDETVTHTLHNAQFLTNTRDMKTGDTKIEVPLELIISDISWA